MGNDFDELQHKIEIITDKLEEIKGLFAGVSQNSLNVEDWQLASAQFGRISASIDHECGHINSLLGLGGAQSRILTYFLSRIGQIVSKEELRGVAVIYEWARRVRELRVEHGWNIITQSQRSDLNPGEYVLVSGTPDERIASDWKLAKTIKGKSGGGKAKGLAYLQELSPRSADKDQLYYVMGIKTYARRLRELSEEGWFIYSNVDDPNLAPGSYRLGSLEQRTPRARQAIKLRHQILDRDGYKCADDGKTPDNDGVTLQIHHLKFVSQGGDNSPDNLITLCADCHAGRHAIARSAAKDELLDPGWADPIVNAEEG